MRPATASRPHWPPSSLCSLHRQRPRAPLAVDRHTDWPSHRIATVRDKASDRGKQQTLRRQELDADRDPQRAVAPQPARPMAASVMIMQSSDACCALNDGATSSHERPRRRAPPRLQCWRQRAQSDAGGVDLGGIYFPVNDRVIGCPPAQVVSASHAVCVAPARLIRVSSGHHVSR
jgi:hypothetical protein